MNNKLKHCNKNYKRPIYLLILSIFIVCMTSAAGIYGSAGELEDIETEKRKVIGASLASEQTSYQQTLGNLLEAEADSNSK